jgi:anti-sigma factor RsiW
MKCDEVQPLCGTYLDSELDTRTSLEIQQHLKACPACARLFAEEEKLEGRLKAGLNRGARTAALWERIERSVAAAASAPARPGPSPRLPQRAGWSVLLQVLGEQLLVGWGRARWAWAGLGMAWVVILALNFAAREPEAALAAGKQLPPAAEVRFAVKQKQLMMADLVPLAEPAPADKVKTVPPSPRSDRRTETLNT